MQNISYLSPFFQRKSHYSASLTVLPHQHSFNDLRRYEQLDEFKLQLKFTLNSLQKLLYVMTIIKTPFFSDALLFQCVKLFHQLNKHTSHLLDSNMSNKKLATALIHGWHLLSPEQQEQLANVMVAFAEQYNPDNMESESVDSSLSFLLEPWINCALSIPETMEWLTALTRIEQLSCHLKIHCRGSQQQFAYSEHYQHQAIIGNLIQLGENYNRFLLSFACDKIISNNLFFQSEIDRQQFVKYINKQPIKMAGEFVGKLRKIGFDFLTGANKHYPNWFDALNNCRKIRNNLRHKVSMEMTDLSFSELFIIQLSDLHRQTQSLRQYLFSSECENGLKIR